MGKFSDSYNLPSKSQISLYTNALQKYKGKFVDETFTLKLLPNEDVGICVKFSVDAGSDSQLNYKEPVVIGTNSADFENAGLYVFPDRTDFPFECFPHINYPKNDLPATLCLTRENFDDWYAEHTFEDFLHLIKNWLNDAAHGNLIKLKDKDYYESFRSHNPDVFLFRVPYEDKHIEQCAVYDTLYYAVHKLDTKYEGLYRCNIIDNNFEKSDGIGMLFVKPSDNVFKTWFVKYPSTLKELIEFIYKNGFKFEFQKLIELFRDKNCQANKLFFQFAFLRPTIVIGKHTRVDYLTFSMDRAEFENYNESAKVSEVQVIDSLVPDFAQYLSSTPSSIANKRFLILGCGAIGSKLIFHLCRSGICNLTICDNDNMQPHNICRHALTSGNMFRGKVEMVKEELKKMYPAYPLLIKTVNEDLLEWLPSCDFSQYDIIIDATASAAVMRCVDSLRSKTDIPIAQFALSEAGKVGRLYINQNRETLLADFYIHLAKEAIDYENLQEWLQKEQEYSLDYVRIGEGCHSNTMILSDDTVSTHTAIAAKIIRNFDFSSPNNMAYLSYTDYDYIGQVFTDNFLIDNMQSIPFDNKPGWQMRIPFNLLKSIRMKAKTAYPKETGGYLMGYIDEKHHTIYVVHTFIPPSVNKHNTKVSLPTKGWESEYKKVRKNTATVLDYLGDWHSHPTGSLDMSQTDIETSSEIRQNEVNQKYAICVITNSKDTAAYIIE